MSVRRCKIGCPFEDFTAAQFLAKCFIIYPKKVNPYLQKSSRLLSN